MNPFLIFGIVKTVGKAVVELFKDEEKNKKIYEPKNSRKKIALNCCKKSSAKTNKVEKQKKN